MGITQPLLILMACSLGIGCDRAERQAAQTTQREAKVEQGYVEVEGGRLYYEVVGTGEPVVLIHGNLVDLRSWDDQLPALSQSFHVIRYDVRGFGRSSLPTEGEAYSHHEDLVALLGHLGVSSAHIVGLSMGSGIAVDFVIEHPSMSRSLVAAGPSVSGYGADRPSVTEVSSTFAETTAALNEGGGEAALRSFYGSPLLTKSIRDTAVRQRLRQIGSDYSFWHFSHADPARGLEPPAVERLSEISVPTLVVVGAREIAFCREVGELLQQMVPDVRTVEIPNAGHVMSMENPPEFNRAVSEFLTGVSGAN
jgi:pimeloyl-ACP methyl ester carboxylesterase